MALCKHDANMQGEATEKTKAGHAPGEIVSSQTHSAQDHTAQHGTADWPAPPPPKGRRARRLPLAGYSRMVFLMKVLLPSIAVVLVGLVIAWPELISDDNRFRLSAVRIDQRDADTLRMVNPRYVGTDDRNQPFTVTADIAMQSSGNADLVTLDQPKADLALQDGSWVALTASDGMYYRDRQSIDLKGAVNIFHDSGYEFRSESALIDLKAGTAAGKETVTGQGPGGDIEAEGFQILDRGARILFTGKARLVMYPAAGG